jgi:hypothetical protein
MFKRLIEKLYFKWGRVDICKMTRKQLGVFNKPEHPQGKSEQDSFYMEAQSLSKNSALNFILDELVEDIKEEMILHTEEENMIHDRFTINGVSLLKERLESYGSLAPNLEVEFDKYSVT